MSRARDRRNRTTLERGKPDRLRRIDETARGALIRSKRQPLSEAQQFGGSGLRDGMPGLHSGCANAGRACRHRWLVAWYGPRRGPSTESNHQGAGVAPLVIKYGCAGRETNVVCMDEAASPHQRDDRVPAPTDAARDGAPVHIMSGPPRLGQIEPRERAGAQTGRKYEYQYERTARAALIF